MASNGVECNGWPTESRLSIAWSASLLADRRMAHRNQTKQDLGHPTRSKINMPEDGRKMTGRATSQRQKDWPAAKPAEDGDLAWGEGDGTCTFQGSIREATQVMVQQTCYSRWESLTICDWLYAQTFNCNLYICSLNIFTFKYIYL